MTPRPHRHAATAPAAAAIALAAVFLALAAGGCLSQGPRNYENENDRLRARVLELEERVEDLTAERDELLTKLRDTEAKPLEPQALEALPRVAGIRFDPLTGLDDNDTSPGMDRVIAYVKPYDGRRRFVQVAGTLRIEAFVLPVGEDGGEPRRIASATLSPAELREAYRYNFTGQHYTVTVPIDPPNAVLDGPVVIQAELTDAISGRTFSAEHVVER